MPTPHRALFAVVLAAGEGSRMRSERPKPLHRLCGRPMLSYVLDALVSAEPLRVVVVIGHKGDWVTKAMQEETAAFPLDFVEQRVQRGTGDATEIGLVGLPDDDEVDAHDVVVLAGDTPLLRPETLSSLVQHHRDTDAAATLLTAVPEDPTGYGRVVRGRDDMVDRVIDAGEVPVDGTDLDEVNAGVYCFRRSVLAPALRRLEPDNAQGEFFLADVIGVLSEAGYPVRTLRAHDPQEAAGVNDRVQLAVAEAELRRRTNETLLASGVTMVDPSRTYVDATVRVGRDVTLFPGVILQGATEVGDGCELGANVRLIDTVVGPGCVLTEVSGRRAHVGEGATVGPYASLEPGSSVPAQCVTGPFYTAEADD